MSACKSYKTCDLCEDKPQGEDGPMMPACFNEKCPMFKKNFCPSCCKGKGHKYCECGPPKPESESSSEDENEDYSLCDCCMDNTKDDELCAPCFKEDCKMFQKSFCPQCIKDTEDIDLCKCVSFGPKYVKKVTLENEKLKEENKYLEGKFIHERDENRRISLIDLKSIHYEKMKKENEKLKEENKKLSETILKWQEKADFNMDELYQDCLPDVWDQM